MKDKYRYNRRRRIWLIGGLALFSLAGSLACSIGDGAGTAIPSGRPASFEVQTATPTSDSPQVVVELEPDQPAAQITVEPLSDAPTHTPGPPPSPTPTLVVQPTATPAPIIAETSEPEPAQPEPVPTDTPAPPPEAPAVQAQPPVPPVEPDPPLEGGDWDFEAEFIPWPNPYGEPCPGASVASGWTAFVEQGEYGSSCMNENLYQPNVFSGLKSQEITFDFIAANSGVFRTIPTNPGHRYSIVAYGKHDFSVAPVQLYLGIDLSGGGDWQAGTVEWFPWDNPTEDTWGATEETVTANGERMTIFIRGFHPMADQGGKTVFDNVSVTDLGP